MRLVGLSLERIAIFCREPLVNRLDLDDLAHAAYGRRRFRVSATLHLVDEREPQREQGGGDERQQGYPR